MHFSCVIFMVYLAKMYQSLLYNSYTIKHNMLSINDIIVLFFMLQKTMVVSHEVSFELFFGHCTGTAESN